MAVFDRKETPYRWLRAILDVNPIYSVILAHQPETVSVCLAEVKGRPFRGGSRCHACEGDENNYFDEKNMSSVAGTPTNVDT